MERFEFQFKNTKSNITLSRFFKVKVLVQKFKLTDFQYNVLRLIPDEETKDDWNEDASEPVPQGSNNLPIPEPSE